MNSFIQGILDRLSTVLDPAILGDQAAAFLGKLIIALATFVLFYLVWRVLQRSLRSAFTRMHLDETVTRFALTITKVVVLTIGLVYSLSAVGINTTSVIASLGIAGITIGFAARDGLSNIISGIFIFWDRPFVIGDLIEVEGHYGTVDDITLRATRVVTSDGRMLSIPNTTVVNSTVASYTNFPHLRLDIPVGIGANEDIDRARMLMLDVVASDPAFMDQPPPRVNVTELGDYTVTLNLSVWLDDERTHVAKRDELRETLYKTLLDAAIDMPNETLSLTPVELRTTSG